MDNPNLDTKAAADGKKKKSTFRITSIIDPVKNDDDEDNYKADNVDETEETSTASRFRMIKSQTPNPRAFTSGRWKVKEIYSAQINHKESSGGHSSTSNESAGDIPSGENTRCPTPQSTGSAPGLTTDIPEREMENFDIPGLDSYTDFQNKLTEEFSSFISRSQRQYESLHSLTSKIHREYEKLKKDYLQLREENSSLKEEIRRLRSR